MEFSPYVKEENGSFLGRQLGLKAYSLGVNLGFAIPTLEILGLYSWSLKVYTYEEKYSLTGLPSFNGPSPFLSNILFNNYFYDKI